MTAINTIFFRIKCLALMLAVLVSQFFSPSVIESGLEWEDEIITVVSESAGFYPRLCKLADGTMLCGFATRSGAQRSYISVRRSTDGGKSWSDSAQSATQFPQYNCDNANFLQLKNGDILLSYRAILTDSNGTYTSLRTAISKDNGYTWSDHSLIVEYSNTLFKGVWEPHLGYIGDTVAVFYANDDMDNGSVEEDYQQNIEYRLYKNGGWSDAHIVSSGVKTYSRDGMPVWCQLKDGSYALVIEGTRSMEENNDVHNGMFIKLMLSKDGLNWNETKAMDVYYPSDSTRSAGAPGIVCLPDGRIAISFQTDEDCETVGNIPEGKGYTMKVIVSAVPVTYLSCSIVFSECDVPFEIPDNKFALWTGMLYSDGFLYACAGTNHPKTAVIIRRAVIEAQ